MNQIITKVLMALVFTFRSQQLYSKIILQTPRVVVREFTMQDVPEFAQILADKDVMRFSLSGPISYEQTLDRVKSYIDHYRRYGFGRWALILKERQKLIGYCGITKTPPIDDEIFYEIGYRLDQSVWGQGLATEVVSAIKNYAVNTLKIPLIVAVVEPENTASIKVIEKIGMKFWKQSLYHHLLVNVYKNS